MRKIDTQHIGWYFFWGLYLDIVAFPMRVFFKLKQTLRFVRDHRQYILALGKTTVHEPVFIYGQLEDRTSGTGFDQQYVYQSWWAFDHIRNNLPVEHVDVGSLIEFVGYVSILTKTIFIDIRPPKVTWPNFVTKPGSILNLPYADNSVQSLSCMHVTEHIGLGRYGDPLNPGGTVQAIKQLQRVLAPGGRLYFSTPTGRPRTYFNAHRISSPEQILGCFNELRLLELSAIMDNGTFQRNVGPEKLSSADYACGLYLFTKD